MNIDSDKLFDWLIDYGQRHGKTDNGAIILRPTDLATAIQSGELAEKKVYARAPDEKTWLGDSIKPGGIYEVENEDEEGFKFYIERKLCYANWNGSNHLNGANWERVEK